MMKPALIAVGLLALFPFAGARAAITPEACDSPAFQSIQHAAVASFDARAVWLDRRLLTWPGAAIVPTGEW
jgi:pullulanase